MNKGQRTRNALSASLIGGLLLAIVGISAGFRLLTSPVDPKAEEKIMITVTRGDSIDAIGKKLTNEDLIRSKGAFKILVVGKGLQKSIQAGDYELSKAMSLDEISKTLTHGTSDIRVTLIEGWRREEMAMELSDQFTKRGLSFNREEFLAATEGKEGYLFPDTYFIPTGMEAREIADLLSETFTRKIGQDTRTAIGNQGLSMEQAIILASLVEREARFATDRPLVAGILIKRWKNQWPLQVDATIQYALGYQQKEDSWWKKSLTKADIEINSPLNTYKRTGLPPSPICNPSLASLNAVANPQESAFWFYLSDNEGQLHYAQTIEEHNRNIATYLNK